MPIPRPSNNLPWEISDAIIDHLHDDRPSLYSCALVCRAWLLSSRHHLFRTFKIADSKRRKPNSAALDKAVGFLATTPDVARHIRYLDIAHHSVRLSQLDAILNCLPKLQSLAFSELGILDDDTNHITRPFPRFRAIEELKITSCNIVNYDYSLLFHFLGLFASIQRLELMVEIRVLNIDTTADLIPPAHLALTHLSAFHVPLSVILKLLQYTRTKETLRVLWYDDTILDWPDVEEVGNLFVVLGPYRSLKRIVFGPLNIFTPYHDNFPPDQEAEDIGRWPALQLERCNDLEEFSLRTRMILRVHVDLFAHLPQSVRRIWVTLIGIDQTVADPGADSQWAEFDAAFSREEFQRLVLVLDTSRVKAQISVEKYAELLDRATKGLSQVSAQGRLVISEVDRNWWNESWRQGQAV
ncbi:hypothetical protein L227DRAFT_581653 [Lentinus tigrinus ALCF2SS1-6]|uniref:F-box domain-containing protein n=2 Tax=Lentinus tigrinus TaxID=5365 RepID=A0A5C2RPL1_9APHY|nr:hypothetical protein L227DRAFT_581653 [Lentinus tigrinus ALCF2SS1-6]